MEPIRIGHCRTCQHWQSNDNMCPMMFYWATEGVSQKQDNAPKDGSGFCHKWQKKEEQK